MKKIIISVLIFGMAGYLQAADDEMPSSEDLKVYHYLEEHEGRMRDESMCVPEGEFRVNVSSPKPISVPQKPDVAKQEKCQQKNKQMCQSETDVIVPDIG